MKISKTEKTADALIQKTVDLEDRSRRCNLVFFNFAETATRHEEENCEQKVLNLLTSLRIFDDDDEIWVDRAHRLGRRRPENNTKPRPIIVKFSYYKQKQKIINNGSKFKNSPINVSEDYSKETIKVHNQLRQLGKNAKDYLFTDDNKSITHYKVAYRRLVLTYTTNKHSTTAPTFTRSFSLDYIQEHENWFEPPQQHSTN